MNRKGKKKERETRISRGKATGRDQGNREPSGQWEREREKQAVSRIKGKRRGKRQR